MCAVVNRWLFSFPFLISHEQRSVEVWKVKFLSALGGRLGGKKSAVLVESFEVSCRNPKLPFRLWWIDRTSFSLLLSHEHE